MSIKNQLKELMRKHRLYTTNWGLIEIEEDYGILKEKLREYDLRLGYNVPEGIMDFYIPLFHLTDRITGGRISVGVFGARKNVMKKIERYKKLIDTDKIIKDKLYDIWNVYVDVEDESDEKLSKRIREVGDMINNCSDEMFKITFNKQINQIKKSINIGRHKFAKMSEVEQKLNELSNLEHLFSENDFFKRQNNLISKFNDLSDLFNKSQYIIRDAKWPFIYNIIIAILLIISLVLAYVAFIKT